MTAAQRFRDLCTFLEAHRLELLRISGRLAERAEQMDLEQAGPKVCSWASETLIDSLALSAGARELTRRADELLDETVQQPIVRDEEDGTP
ncbi:MAG TPA: hypothetical protein VFG69_01650 [Nannocystaceae bacterium]|nr:hypothetical protein [Nannocystaceae bacterium]